MDFKKAFIHPTAIVDDGALIGHGSKIWHFCHILGDVEIGSDCSFGQNCMVGPRVKIGKNVKVQNNVSIYEGALIEDDVFLGPSCVLTNVINPRSGVNRRSQFMTTHIKKGTTVGANATIVCGVTLGEYSFIGAGAVVTKNVPAYSLMVGNPARQKGWMSEFGEKLQFDENNRATCPHTGSVYLKEDNRVEKL